MRASPPPLAPVSHLIRPQRAIDTTSALDRFGHLLGGLIGRSTGGRVRGYRAFARRVIRLEGEMAALDDGAFSAEAQRLRTDLVRSGFSEAELVRAFAMVREAGGRTLGMRHFEAQIIGGIALFDGVVAEMATGEGKTLTATLPASVAALAGIPVHVVTVNDYLTARDAEIMMPIYDALGISVGVVVHDLEPAQRREEYARQVTYCTNKELVFDYLKDQMTLADRTHHLRLEADRLMGRESRTDRLMLRGLHYAIVDEIDSILVDEARTPLIISASTPGNPEQERVFRQALDLAGGLEEDVHYTHDPERRHVELEDEGFLEIRERAADLGPYWCGRVRREEMVRQALSALLLFERDRHYLVRDDKVQIIDEYTGRIMEDRSWERGLHQLIELKEGVELTQPRETLARISYQRFFRQYQRLSGMTGTAEEIKGELWTTYGLAVAKIPLNRPLLRTRKAPWVLPDEETKWAAVVERVTELHRAGCPVLVGTHSVGASERLSELLDAAGLEHRVLNAKQDADEAQIVGEAGQAGHITVATNMAGRGTDIKLGDGIVERGGLHVILTERHESGRIDRQLEGRCARQGDPGSYESIVSLEDYLVTGPRGGRLARLARSPVCAAPGLRNRLGWLAMNRSQRRLERLHAKVRRSLLSEDERQADLLAFSGRKA